MNKKKSPPFKSYLQSQNQPYYAPFEGQYYYITGWVLVGNGPPPSQPPFQWNNPQTKQRQGIPYHFHPTPQFTNQFPPLCWRPPQ